MTTAAPTALRCFASKACETIIDTVNPETGLTWCYGRTLARCREEYPDAEEMTVEAFCAWKAARQRTPITWSETTEEAFIDALEVLPPAAAIQGYRAFLLGEPCDHDALTGAPRYDGFRRDAARYYRSSRPMTCREFRAEMDNWPGVARIHKGIHP